MQKAIYTLLILLFLLTCSHAAMAQGPDDFPGDPGAVPIDGGLSLLVAAGVGYGARKLRGKRKEKKGEL